MISRTEGFITVADGERVWYETAGEGPDLILTHGLGGNAAVWYQQVPYFAQHYRVISWDQRGFGRSTNENGNHGPVAAVSDLIEIMDLLAVDRAHVVGQSMGGWAALGTAIAVPDRVESVVLACTTGGIPVGFGPDSAPPLTAAPITARPLGSIPLWADGCRAWTWRGHTCTKLSAPSAIAHLTPSSSEFSRPTTIRWPNSRRWLRRFS